MLFECVGLQGALPPATLPLELTILLTDIIHFGGNHTLSLSFSLDFR